jgi:DNA polymerase-3 subunit delta'
MTSLHGHAPLVAAFLDAAHGGRLHHAWLLAGPQGVGKARFADAVALRLLAESAGPPLATPGLDVPEEHRIARLIAAGSHPDLRRLERLPKDKGDELARSIGIAQVRALQSLFASTPGLSPRRIIIIDAIDDLERGAANALLKNLEEPPADTTFLLVSHAPGRLLPTIRSRCRLLRFSALDGADTAAVLRTALPDADEQEIATLVAVSGGAPGAALRFAGLDISGLDAAIDRLAREGDPTNAQRVALARALALKSAQARYEIFLERAPARIAAAARTRHGRALADAVELWERARAVADGAIRLSADPQVTVFELAGLLARLAPERAPAKA